MHEEKLKRYVQQFYDEFRTTEEFAKHQAEHARRCKRAQQQLTPERIASLTEDEIRELYFDSDAFGFWSNKEREFQRRVERYSLDGVRERLVRLIEQGEEGINAEGFKQVLDAQGIGLLLATELLTYRFPDRYCTYSPNVTLPGLNILGVDLKGQMPHGERSKPHLFLASLKQVTHLRQALHKIGFEPADNLLVDIFVWWLHREGGGTIDVTKGMVEEALRQFDRDLRETEEWTGWEEKRIFGYAIAWEDKLYPVKEIYRRASDKEAFNSIQARAVYKKLGFEVVPLRRKASNVWLFQARPDRYDLTKELRRVKQSWWFVTRYSRQIQPGDRIVLWMSGKQRGIYGMGRLVGEVQRKGPGQAIVDVAFDGRLAEPLLQPALAKDEVLAELQVLKSPQGTNFRVAPEQWEVLRGRLGELIPPDPDAVIEEWIEVNSSVGDILATSLDEAMLRYTPWQIATFYTALQTKGFVILSGISGTGKTKIAQHLARLLPPPTDRDTLPDDTALRITVMPYMLKYRKIVPSNRLADLVEVPAPGESTQLQVHAGDHHVTCTFTHAARPSASDYLNLYLGKEIGTWLVENFKSQDELLLEPLLDDDGALSGMVLQAADEPAVGDTGDGDVEPSYTATSPVQPSWLFVPVRPDWRDGKSLIGYYNPLTGTYEWTPFLRFLHRATRAYGRGEQTAWLVILDEMNLARVEYYFSDLLSVLESGRDDEGWTCEPLRLNYPDDASGDLPPRELRLPPTLYLVGTVNVDETTHTISPKVLDRAFTLELTEADFGDYPPSPKDDASTLEIDADERMALLADFTRDGTGARVDKAAIYELIEAQPEYRDRLQALSELLRPHQLHFGFRAFDEIISFMTSAQQNGLFDPLGGLDAAFDTAVLMKVLPKFHGSRNRLEQPLRAVLSWCVDPEEGDQQSVNEALDNVSSAAELLDTLADVNFRYAHTADRVTRMLWSLYTDHFASFS